jgi:hypothetical protein
MSLVFLYMAARVSCELCELLRVAVNGKPLDCFPFWLLLALHASPLSEGFNRLDYAYEELVLLPTPEEGRCFSQAEGARKIGKVILLTVACRRERELKSLSLHVTSCRG